MCEEKGGGSFPALPPPQRLAPLAKLPQFDAVTEAVTTHLFIIWIYTYSIELDD